MSRRKLARELLLFPVAMLSLGVLAWRIRRDLFGFVRFFSGQDPRGNSTSSPVDKSPYLE